MSWKDDCREHKQETGLTWSEYHERYFTHEHDIDSLRAEVEELSEHVEACKNSYQDLQRELHELRVMMQSDRDE
jgi:flagellar biosynthesis chaperone FliJ